MSSGGRSSTRLARPVWNPPNRFESREVEPTEPPPDAELEVTLEDARSALSRNDSPDLPFTWSLNPYRGCQHACAYCYARPTHEYLGLGAGSDFEKRLVVKRNLPELLARELARPALRGQPIAVSGVTDPYQPLEARHQLTRRCLEVCDRRGNPVAVVTKGTLVRRDAELLARMQRRAGARVYVSIPFADPEVARLLEPGTPTPAERLETLRILSAAGVSTGLAVAPWIPRLTEEGLAELVRSAAEAGAERAFTVLLRLPGHVEDVFTRRLREAMPGRAEAVLAALREARDGSLGESRFGLRMRGVDRRSAAARDLFDLLCRRHGLASSRETEPPAPGSADHVQGELFEP